MDYLFNKLKDGHTFNKEDWHGGLAHLPLITSCLSLDDKPKKAPAPAQTKKKIGKAKKPSSQKYKEPESSYVMDLVTAEDLLREVDQKNKEQTTKIERMLSVERSILRDEIVDDVLKCLREKGVFGSTNPPTHSDLMAQLRKPGWSNYGTGFQDILNNISKSSNDHAVGVKVRFLILT